MARRINPDSYGKKKSNPGQPVRFPKSTPTKEGFLRPAALDTYRKAYKPTQVQNERSGVKPVIKAANKERELQRIAARQRLMGDGTATVNSAKRNYNKRAERRAVTGPKTDKAVGTKQRGSYNDTMDTSLNPLGGGKRPTQNRYLNTWESPDTLAPKRPTQIKVETDVYSGGKHQGGVGPARVYKNIKEDKSGTYAVRNKYTLYGPNAQKNSLPFKGKRGAANSNTRKGAK